MEKSLKECYNTSDATQRMYKNLYTYCFAAYLCNKSSIK